MLPEIWNSAYETTSFPGNAEDIDSENSVCANFLSEAAKRHAITLVGGSIPESSEGRVFNTCLVYSKEGKLLAKHRKVLLYAFADDCRSLVVLAVICGFNTQVHLFDIDIPGKQTFRESDTLAAGRQLTVVDTDAGRLGIGICYDIRFPEMAAIYARRGVQMLVYPGCCPGHCNFAVCQSLSP